MSRFAVINGPDLYVRGSRAHNTTARFDLTLSDGTVLGAGLTWTEAYPAVQAITNDVPDTEALLHQALHQYDYEKHLEEQS
jgi:hypothetical protein